MEGETKVIASAACDDCQQLLDFIEDNVIGGGLEPCIQIMNDEGRVFSKVRLEQVSTEPDGIPLYSIVLAD